MKLPEPNKRTWPMHDGRGAPEYYTLKEAAEVLEIVCQCRDLSESDAAALASGLGLTFHVVARPIAMGDTLIIPPYPRPNNATKLHWMDLQRLIDHCAENPQFINERLQKRQCIDKVEEEYNQNSVISNNTTLKSRRLETMFQVNKKHPNLQTKREVFEKCKEINRGDFSIEFESFSTGSTAIWNTAKEAGINWKNIG